MSSYAENTSQWLVGKTIHKAKMSGYGVRLEFEDGTTLDYGATDGGHSFWTLYNAEGKQIGFQEGDKK